MDSFWGAFVIPSMTVCAQDFWEMRDTLCAEELYGAHQGETEVSRIKKKKKKKKKKKRGGEREEEGG